MSYTNRRKMQRRKVEFPVSLQFTYEVVELKGRTVDVSPKGVYLEALGRIPLLVDVAGKTYRGHLVRASPVDAESTAYGIAMEDAFDIDSGDTTGAEPPSTS